MAEERLKLPWIPGFKRPKFIFYKIKITIPTKIPSSVIFGAIFLSVLYIYAGGVYDLVEQPFARGADQQGNPILILPDEDRQFLLEGVVAGLLMFMGAAGLYLLNQATTDPHDTSRASTFQMLGVVLIVLAFLILQSMYDCKVNPNQC